MDLCLLLLSNFKQSHRYELLTFKSQLKKGTKKFKSLEMQQAFKNRFVF